MLPKFWNKLKNCVNWIKTHSSIILLSFGLILLSSLIFFYQQRKIKQLQIELAILKAKLKLERLALENETSVNTIADLKEKDKKIEEELKKIEESLKIDLPDDMTEEDIIKKFKELGLYK